AGRAELGRLHLRVYTGIDYLERWAAHFNGEPTDVSGGPAGRGPEAAGELRAELRRRKLRLKDLACGINVDPSFLSKVLAGMKPVPMGLLGRARRWLARPRDARGVPKSVRPQSPPRTPPPEVDTLLDVALAYVERGWCVVPQLRGSKMPC